MDERDIIQNSISQLGQSQADRAAKELDPHFVDVDEREPADLLRLAQELAAYVNYYRGNILAPVAAPPAIWRRFLSRGSATAEQLLAPSDDKTPAQLALFLAFLQLYQLPRGSLNRFTERHRDFFYRDVLRFVPRAPVADHAHVIVELKKHAAATRILPEHQLSAGKDARKAEQVYQPVRESVVNTAKIDRVHGVYVDSRNGGVVRIAPVASSADGLGGALPERDPSWAPFHDPDVTLPAGEIGFALASPVLRMREGRRTVKIALEVQNPANVDLSDAALRSAFEVSLTGEKRWLGPYQPAVKRSSGELSIEVTIPATDEAVVDYSAKIHGYAYATTSPVAQVLLKTEGATIGYTALAQLRVMHAQVSVDVDGITSLALESDAGTLDPKKAFLPFGAQPVQGSRFFIGCAEALSKALTALELTIDWHGAPDNFATHYTNYDTQITNDSFQATIVFSDGSGPRPERGDVKLFPGGGKQKTVIDVIAGTSSASGGGGGAGGGATGAMVAAIWDVGGLASQIWALSQAGSSFAMRLAYSLALVNPRLGSFLESAPEPKSGFVTMSLERDFLHAEHRKKTLENVLTFSKQASAAPPPVVLNEPYTPSIRGLSLRYAAASSRVPIDSTVDREFAAGDVQLFHVDAFGQRREHGYLRHALLGSSTVPLLPEHGDGELLLGVAGLAAGASVSVLFQVAEGSADPDVATPEVSWSVLCDNYWKPLDSTGVVLDTTNRFRRSGLVVFVIPREATTTHTLLPSQRVWLRASVPRPVEAASRLLLVAANALEVRFVDRGNDPAHLDKPLPAGSIARWKTPIATVKSVAQPYASFGGRPRETAPALVTRAAERLRHKDRCITPWDYERVVLEAFPRVHKSKCVPHADGAGGWLKPGHVLLVVIPDLRNDNARNPLEPRVDADTLSRIGAYVAARAGMQLRVEPTGDLPATLHVRNPTYQKIRLEFKLRLHRGYEFKLYSRLLGEELKQFLTPWAFDAARPISFGGRVYRSVLLDFVEERPYVDYVTDFKMYSYVDDAAPGPDLVEAQAAAPDAILVSAPTHRIGEV